MKERNYAVEDGEHLNIIERAIHKIAQPLQVISGGSTLLDMICSKENPDLKQIRKISSDILAASDKIISLINEFRLNNNKLITK